MKGGNNMIFKQILALQVGKNNGIVLFALDIEGVLWRANTGLRYTEKLDWKKVSNSVSG